jgi:hypothetical protein
MTVNAPLMWKVLEHIEAHPEEWDQGFWGVQWGVQRDCTTTYCFAGWACVIGGNDQQQPHLLNDGVRTHLIDETVGGSEIADEAIELLGIDTDAATVLFDNHNTLDDLRELVERYTADTGE